MFELVENLTEQGVSFAWAPKLNVPAVWVASHSLMVLNAAAPLSVTSAVLRDLAEFIALDPEHLHPM